MTNNNNTLFNGLLFVLVAAIILQLDAYFYLSGIHTIKPWNIVLVVFLLFALRQAVNDGPPSWQDVTARPEVVFLLFCVLIYILVQLIGIFSWNSLPDEKIILGFWLYMLVLVILGLLTGHELKQKRTDFFLLVLIFHTAILAIDSIFGGISDTSHWARASGTLRNPNNAAFLGVALMAGSIRWDRDHPGIKESIALLLTVVVIGLTGSRGGGALSFFVLLCMMLLWWVCKARVKPQRIQRTFIAATLISAIMAITLLAIYEMRYVKRANMKLLQAASVAEINQQQPVSMTQVMHPNDRDRAMDMALELIQERPWTGHGTGYVYTQEVGPHNMLLRSLIEVGVIGLLAYLLLPLGLLWVAGQRRDWGLAALTLCGLTAGLVSHNMTENRSYLIIVGIMLWMNKDNRFNELSSENSL